jgi:hypothetical protein
MTRTLECVQRDATTRELQKMFDDVDFKAFLVRENDAIVGLESNFDFLKCFAFTPARIGTGSPRGQDALLAVHLSPARIRHRIANSFVVELHLFITKLRPFRFRLCRQNLLKVDGTLVIVGDVPWLHFDLRGEF